MKMDDLSNEEPHKRSEKRLMKGFWQLKRRER